MIGAIFDSLGQDDFQAEILGAQQADVGNTGTLARGQFERAGNGELEIARDRFLRPEHQASPLARQVADLQLSGLIDRERAVPRGGRPDADLIQQSPAGRETKLGPDGPAAILHLQPHGLFR